MFGSWQTVGGVADRRTGRAPIGFHERRSERRPRTAGDGPCSGLPSRRPVNQASAINRGKPGWENPDCTITWEVEITSRHTPAGPRSVISAPRRHVPNLPAVDANEGIGMSKPRRFIESFATTHAGGLVRALASSSCRLVSTGWPVATRGTQRVHPYRPPPRSPTAAYGLEYSVNPKTRRLTTSFLGWRRWLALTATHSVNDDSDPFRAQPFNPPDMAPMDGVAARPVLLRRWRVDARSSLHPRRLPHPTTRTRRNSPADRMRLESGDTGNSYPTSPRPSPRPVVLGAPRQKHPAAGWSQA